MAWVPLGVSHATRTPTCQNPHPSERVRVLTGRGMGLGKTPGITLPRKGEEENIDILQRILNRLK